MVHRTDAGFFRAMSHAAIYAVKPDVHYVIHVHDAELWNSLHVAPTTDAGIPYGTPIWLYAHRN